MTNTIGTTEMVSAPLTDVSTGGTASVEQTELEKVRAALHAANAESKSRRTRLAALEAAEVTRQQAEMTSDQKLTSVQQELANIKAELLTERAKGATLMLAAKMGFAHPEDAFTLLDLEDIDASDSKQIEKALEALVRSGRLPLMKSTTTNVPSLPGLQSKTPGAGIREMPSPGRRL